jgi:glucans biosynthesis protein C
MGTKKERLYYVDWLRVIIFGLLFLFHTTRFFDTYPWHIKNAETSIAVNYFVEFTHSWRMQVVFLVSGVGTFFAIRSRKNLFFKDRIHRLIVPFIFGIIILIPPQKYVEALSQSGYPENFWIFLKNYPATLFRVHSGFNMLWTGHIGHHIWYLAYLFIQTVLLLPLLNLLKDSQRFKTFFSRLTATGVGICTLIIPFVILEFALRPLYPGYLDWADFAIYSLFFLYGFIFQLSDTIVPAIEKYLFTFLMIGVVIWGGYLLNKEIVDQISVPTYSIRYFFTVVIKNINSFVWVMAIVGLSKKYLNFKHRLLHDLNQGILPFYILHQTIIILFGYFIVQWNLSIMEKFIIIFTLSLMSTIGLYQIIYRIGIFRFLFGMKNRGDSVLPKAETVAQL